MNAAGVVTLLLLWTNPSLNADGTPCTDLATITVRGVREADGLVIENVDALCDTTGCHSGPGVPDSTDFVIPQRQGQDWWHFNVLASDSTGNTSDPSNTVRVDLGDGGPITGVPVEPGDPRSTVVEWFNVLGQKIDGPKASGVYFRRIGKVVRKVVLVK
jgi:hypothetical protein